MNLRTLQRFLSVDGVYTVSTTAPASRVIVCDCGSGGTCAHLQWVKDRARGGVFPLHLSEEIGAEDLQDLLEGPLEVYEEFLTRNGKVVVI